MGLDFRPLEPAESQRLLRSLRANVASGQALHMDASTAFVPDPHDEERAAMEAVVSAIKSVPCHYS